MMQFNSRMQAVAGKSNRISVFVIVAICIILGTVLLVARNSLRDENRAYAAQEEELQDKIAQESLRSEELDTYSQYVKSDEFAEKMAREKFGLVREDEYVIKAEN